MVTLKECKTKEYKTECNSYNGRTSERVIPRKNGGERLRKI
jgi:hypothetical protein